MSFDNCSNSLLFTITPQPSTCLLMQAPVAACPHILTHPLTLCLDPQDVLVSTAGLPDMHFVANRWLSTDETLAKDKQTYVTLYPDTGQDAGGGVHNYRIHVSDVWGEGRLLRWGWRMRAERRVQWLTGVAVLQVWSLALSFKCNTS